MRPQQTILSSLGFSPWLNINRASPSFAIGLGVKLSSGASLTYSIQHTFDPLYEADKEWSASRTTTVGTITKVAHGLSVGDWTKMDAAAPFNTEYSVASVVGADSFTVTVPNSGITAVARGSSNLWTARVFEHDVMTGQIASGDGSYTFPPTACRLAVTTYVSGSASLNVIQAG